MLDDAHLGDIRGALGTIKRNELPPRRAWTKRLAALAAIMGPGLIVMVGDNDAGGVSTYAQAGQNYGTSVMWVLVLLVIVLMVSQEMVVRLGAVTGVGHGRLIKERFGALWAGFSVVDLVILNFATLMTEFIGVGFALSYFGVSPYISVPLSAAGLIAMTVSGSFQRWERAMYVLVVSNLAVFPLALMAHPTARPILAGTLVPGVAGGFNSTSVLFLIAVVGTTVAPWQLFFQQSNIVDKRITPRWINYERADTFIGAIFTNMSAAAIMVVGAFALYHSSFRGHFVNALDTIRAVRNQIGPVAGDFFAIVLLDASLLGAAAVTLSISYAIGDSFGTKHSLHRSWREAKAFYGTFAAIVALAAGLVLIPRAPLGIITEAVQALAGVLLPSAIIFLLMLCNDREVLGPWVNPRWLNALASVIVAALVGLSLILMITTMFPWINVTLIAETIAGILVLVLLGLGAGSLRKTKTRVPKASAEDRARWTMPPLALLERPHWSPGRRTIMYLLRGYLLLAVALLAVKTAQLGFGH